MSTFLPQWQDWVIETETSWFTKPKIFSICLFAKFTGPWSVWKGIYCKRRLHHSELQWSSKAGWKKRFLERALRIGQVRERQRERKNPQLWNSRMECNLEAPVQRVLRMESSVDHAWQIPNQTISVGICSEGKPAVHMARAATVHHPGAGRKLPWLVTASFSKTEICFLETSA